MVVTAGFVIARSEATEAIQPSGAASWIASRSLSSGAHSRDPLARNDDRNSASAVKINYPEDVVLRLRRSTGCRRRSPSKRELTMQYLLLIYRNEAEQAKMDAATGQKMREEYGAFTQSIIQGGNFKAGDALQSSTTATTVRVRDGKTLTTDGPFAETREQLGGYYLVEARDLDAALAIAARIPGAKVGSIEVRPILVYS
jgi:hypothetical protein